MIGSHPHGTHHHFARLLVLVVGAIVTVVITASMVVEQQSAATPSAPCVPLAIIDSVARADLILTGEVFLVVPADPGYATVLITPERVYKGEVLKAGVRIRAKADSLVGGSVLDDLHFASNQPPYLLFLQQDTDGLYRTSKCIGSRSLGSGLTVDERAAFGL
ncbi:MAG: hypothetical protein AAB424_00985 [Patescibacteria group bacterium]